MRTIAFRRPFALALVLALPAAQFEVSAESGDTAGDLIVGQPDTTSNAPNVNGIDASGLNSPFDAAFDPDGNMFVADYGNQRVLGFRAPFTTDLVADLVIGQPDFNSNASNNGGLSASSVFDPLGLVVSPTGDLYVADASNNRVLVFDRPFATDTVADFVIGQPDFTTNDSNQQNVSASSLFSPHNLAIDPDGNLWVVDGSNNRVLEYDDPVATRDTVADIVLGQPSFTTRFANDGVATAESFTDATAVAVDSERNVWVADFTNNRVLEFDNPKRFDTVADRVLGQPSFSSRAANSTGSIDAAGLFGPAGIRIDANDNVYVADSDNNRVLIYTSPTTTRDRIADRVIGQPDFRSGTTNTGGVSARSLFIPSGLAFDAAGNLAVADFANHRVVLIQTPTPIVSSLQVKVSAATGKAKLVVRGFGLTSGRAVVEVNGVELSTTKYKDIAGDGTAHRLVALDAAFDAIVPKGTPVKVVVVNPQTGGRSAPFTLTR